MPKLKDMIGSLGVLPALATGKFGDENRGFALGIGPGLLYKNQYEKDVEEEKTDTAEGMKKGGRVKKKRTGGYVKSADGIAQRGKTRGKLL